MKPSTTLSTTTARMITKYTEDSTTHSEEKVDTEVAARETLTEVVGTQEGRREATEHNMEVLSWNHVSMTTT